MFYKIISRKCNEWLNSDECSVKNFVANIENIGYMRDAQIEAIKTYLFLKIAGQKKPLSKLFIEGFFNTYTVDVIDDLQISSRLRNVLLHNSAALALYEVASLEDDKKKHVSSKIIQQMSEDPYKINYELFFKNVFYNKNYAEYLFSLPMGAGKTFLMAAFIYIDLYFAIQEPDNRNFAHNFIIMVPSGLKSSVIPSLKTIQQFDPEWIFQKNIAAQIKSLIKFEVLEENRSAKKSNKAKDPNVQKISLHQSEPDLMGLVAITNAEKVILNRLVLDKEMSLFEDTDDDRDRIANELRNKIGKIPHLSIMIDEIHHATDSDIKLRQVIERWMQDEANTINSIIGFSGTPYLDKAEEIKITGEISIKHEEISNIVYYYQLIKGIGNFLKKPVVRIASSDATSEEIITEGVNEFLDNYYDIKYDNKYWSKLAIYCAGDIENLEKVVYPQVKKIVESRALNPEEIILKHHGGNKKYPQPADSATEFASLDTELSQKRIILLVQIGKEGWDCRSLTGVILSQKGDCPSKMVLQTSCRCLRQVEKGKQEKALIYLNQYNAQILEKQLKKQQHTDIQEFQRGYNEEKHIVDLYNRTDKLNLPEVKFNQIKIEYCMEKVVVKKDIDKEIKKAVSLDAKRNISFEEKDLYSELANAVSESFAKYESSMPEIANFYGWLQQISKESFGTLTLDELLQHKSALQYVFNKITENAPDYVRYKREIVGSIVRSNIRKAFCEEWEYKAKTEIIPESASLLNIDNWKSQVLADDTDIYYPDREMTNKIIRADNGDYDNIPVDVKNSIRIMKDAGMSDDVIKPLIDQYKVKGHPQQDKSFHYLPYHMDSNMEREFLEKILPLNILEKLKLEVYYNGDNKLTNFRIKCYEKNKKNYQYVGEYTPDFLVLQRKDNEIHRVIIIETKGSLYANDPNFIKRRQFMEKIFIKENKNMDYLYLEDNLTSGERSKILAEKLKGFFKEVA